jgi:copper chaperone NosL
MAAESRLGRALGAGLVAGALAALVWGVLTAQSLPDGPRPIAWDRVTCARCRMLVGDPAFAAQLQTRDGRILDFDDPGCLLLYLDEEAPEVHGVWLHHHVEDRWLRRGEAAFVSVPASPMGYGLAAVDAGTPGSLDAQQALALARERDAARLRGGS